MNLSNENYYSAEANQQYLSASMYKAFLKCESAAMAMVRGEYVPHPSTSFMMGSYVHAWAEEEFDKCLNHKFHRFQTEHQDEIFTQKGQLRAGYVKANEMIETLKRQPLLMRYLGGSQHELIQTGRLFGVPFRGKIDILHQGKAIVDLKTAKDFELIYVEGEGRIPFVEAYGYDVSMYAYQQLVAQNNGGEILPCFIVAVTKQDPPDVALLQIPQYKLDMAGEIIKQRLPEIASVWRGKKAPRRCERCEWCRKTKVIEEILSYEDLYEDE